MSRVMCVCSREDEAVAVRSAMAAEEVELDLVYSDRCDDIVQEVVGEGPDLLIYELRPDSESDRAVLWLLDHVAPRLPVVLMGEGRTGSGPERLGARFRRTPPAVEDIRTAVHEALHARASG